MGESWFPGWVLWIAPPKTVGPSTFACERCGETRGVEINEQRDLVKVVGSWRSFQMKHSHCEAKKPTRR